jgi:hypothetical protein
MTSAIEIEKSISKFLQTNVSFCLENKTLKKGKLILFCLKDFFCIFTLISAEKNNKKIIFEIPYPFSLQQTNSKVIFDYSLSTFCRNNLNLELLVKKINIKKPSKYYNKKVIISPV